MAKRARMQVKARDQVKSRIKVKSVDGRNRLFIDGVEMRYGQLPNGQFYLEKYGYDRSSNLTDLAQKYIDYRGRIDALSPRPPRPKKRVH